MTDRTEVKFPMAGDGEAPKGADVTRGASARTSRRDRPHLGGDAVVLLLLALLAVCYLWKSFDYRISPLSNPGPGMLPVAYGVGLVVVCATTFACYRRLLLQRPAEPRQPDNTPAEEDPTSNWTGVLRPVLVALVLAVFAAVAVNVGFLVALFGVFVLSAFILRPEFHPAAVAKTLVSALVVVGASQLIFVEWMNIPLPTGLTGI